MTVIVFVVVRVAQYRSAWTLLSPSEMDMLQTNNTEREGTHGKKEKKNGWNPLY